MATNTEALNNRDFVIVLDKSASMTETDTPAGQSRWLAAQETTVALAKAVEQFDKDGITVIPFAGSYKVYEGVTSAKVKDIFTEQQPMGSTILAPVLNNVFESYYGRKSKGQTQANGEICVVITDGQPQDEKEVAKTIVNFTKKLDSGDDEYGILFLQVGKDAAAAAFLKRLDDDLVKQGAKHDIVDTKTMDELENIGLTEALMAALND